jgi:hypothetical protein
MELSGGFQTVGASNRGAGSVADNYGGGSGYSISASGALGVRPTANTRIEFSLGRDQSVGYSSTSSGLKFRYDF